jgi:hypothetical protein
MVDIRSLGQVGVGRCAKKVENTRNFALAYVHPVTIILPHMIVLTDIASTRCSLCPEAIYVNRKSFRGYLVGYWN